MGSVRAGFLLWPRALVFLYGGRLFPFVFFVQVVFVLWPLLPALRERLRRLRRGNKPKVMFGVLHVIQSIVQPLPQPPFLNELFAHRMIASALGTGAVTLGSSLDVTGNTTMTGRQSSMPS